MQETLVGSYQILEEIGRGGMGIVYLGEQISLKRQVAIKTLPTEMAHDEEYLQRIENEAKIMAKFSNPNIVNILDRVVQDDTIYLIMEYVPGITVADHLRDQGPYTVDEAARIVIRVAVALEHAHSKGIIHRDIKPSNIMIRNDDVVKVTDFGIAKSSEGSEITRVRFNPGTLEYMSPEQARGLRDIDGRSDIYSLGVVFYMMVTGKLPPFPLPDHLPAVSHRYEEIILKCLAEDRSGRFQSAKALIHALDQAKEEAIRGDKEKRPGPKQSRAGRWTLVGAFAVILLASISIWQMDNIIQYFSPEPEKPAIGTGYKPEPQPSKPQTDTSASNDIIPSEHETESPTTNEALNTPMRNSGPVDQYNEAPAPIAPVLRPAADRIEEFLTNIRNQQPSTIRNHLRSIFALKTGILDAGDNNSDLDIAVRAFLDQTNVVKNVDQGGCDLLIVMDPVSQTVVLTSNLYGDDQSDKYKESLHFQDDQQLIKMLDKYIRKYYCFNVLASIKQLKPMDAAFDAQITLNGGSVAQFKVNDSVNICLNSNRSAYSVLLSANSEGIYMLIPEQRDEDVRRTLEKPLCTGTMEVTPPTGSEMVAAILTLDKKFFPVEKYLASDNQIIIKPASWSYGRDAANSAVDFCENLFASLYAAPADQYSVNSRFIKTYQ
jgi:serine/threonine protein kinase